MTKEGKDSDERMRGKRRETVAKEVTDSDERGKRESRKRGETVTEKRGKTGEKQ